MRIIGGLKGRIEMKKMIKIRIRIKMRIFFVPTHWSLG
jgi:hypothetical protein